MRPGIRVGRSANADDEVINSIVRRLNATASALIASDVTELSKTVDAPGSAWAAGLFAWTDAEYGFWASPSNKEFTGITGTTRAVEYLDGDETCRANLLNNANIATIIRDDGYRLWGNRTLSSDPKWAFVSNWRSKPACRQRR